MLRLSEPIRHTATLAGCATGFFTYQRTKQGENTASPPAPRLTRWRDDQTHKGACVGACIWKGSVKDEAQALAILEQGEVSTSFLVTM
ncbi:hypothetical protein ACLB1N_15385 [Escherichia coli]